MWLFLNFLGICERIELRWIRSKILHSYNYSKFLFLNVFVSRRSWTSWSLPTPHPQQRKIIKMNTTKKGGKDFWSGHLDCQAWSVVFFFLRDTRGNLERAIKPNLSRLVTQSQHRISCEWLLHPRWFIKKIPEVDEFTYSHHLLPDPFTHDVRRKRASFEGLNSTRWPKGLLCLTV